MDSEPRDFKKVDPFSDVTIKVEGVCLYVHRQYLAEWSAVWRRLFLESGNLEPGTSLEIELEDKQLDEVMEMLHCIYSSQKPISDYNVRFLLQFAEEYEMSSMKTRCEDYFLSSDMSLEMLVIAEKYNLKHLYKQCIEFAKTRTLEDLERNESYNEITLETLVKIYREKINMMRDYAKDLKQNENKVTRERDQLVDQKEGMVAMFRNIGKIWDMPNKRCYKHMTDEKFDYTCRDCNEKIEREVRRMCNDGQHVRRFYKCNNT